MIEVYSTWLSFNLTVANYRFPEPKELVCLFSTTNSFMWTERIERQQQMANDRTLRLYYEEQTKSLQRQLEEKNRIIEMLVQKVAEPLSLSLSEIQRLRTELKVHDKMQHIVQGTFQLSEQQEQERRHGGAGASESQQQYDHSVFLHSDILFHMMLYVDAIELLMTIQFVSKPFYNAVRNLLDWDTLSYHQAKLRSTFVFDDSMVTIGEENNHNMENKAIMLDSSLTLNYEQYVSLKKQATNYWAASCSRVGVLHGGSNPRETFMKVFKLRKTEQEKVLRCNRCQHWFSLDDIESRKRDFCDKYITTNAGLGHDFSDAIKKIDSKNRALKFNSQLGSLEPPPPPRFGLISPEPNKLAIENQFPSALPPQPVHQSRNQQGALPYAQQLLSQRINMLH